VAAVRSRAVLRAVGLAGAALALGVWTSGGRGRELDEEAFRAGNGDLGPSADLLLRGVTELGSIWASAGAAAVLVAAGRRSAAARALAAASLTWLAGQGLKRLLARPRPYEADPDGTTVRIGRPRAGSWPSSHPAVLATFLSVVSRDLGLGAATRLGAGALAGAVGASRTYLGVHYPADVAGGLLLGRAVASLFDRRR
jgi:undecaprenyl-diphosphatase